MEKIEALDAVIVALGNLTKAANAHDFQTGFENGLLKAAQNNDRAKIEQIAEKYAFGMSIKDKCIEAANALADAYVAAKSA